MDKPPSKQENHCTIPLADDHLAALLKQAFDGPDKTSAARMPKDLREDLEELHMENTIELKDRIQAQEFRATWANDAQTWRVASAVLVLFGLGLTGYFFRPLLKSNPVNHLTQVKNPDADPTHRNNGSADIEQCAGDENKSPEPKIEPPDINPLEAKLNKKINAEFTDQPIGDVFDMIFKVTGVSFILDDQVRTTGNVSIRCVDMPAIELLRFLEKTRQDRIKIEITENGVWVTSKPKAEEKNFSDSTKTKPAATEEELRIFEDKLTDILVKYDVFSKALEENEGKDADLRELERLWDEFINCIKDMDAKYDLSEIKLDAFVKKFDPAKIKTTDSDLVLNLIKNAKDMKFIRTTLNTVKEYTPAGMANHIAGKHLLAGLPKITAVEFIDRFCSRSAIHGTEYKVRFKDGRETALNEWLKSQLPSKNSDSVPPMEKGYERILAVIEQSSENVMFLRAGQEYDRLRTSAHLTVKYCLAGSPQISADEFVRQFCSKSTQTGTEYKVRLKGGEEFPLAEWLNTKLKEIPPAKP